MLYLKGVLREPKAVLIPANRNPFSERTPVVDKNEKFEAVRRKTRQRIVFTLIVMALYFTYVLNYTGSAGAFLGSTLGDSHISGSLLMFAGLIIVFIVLELIFLWLNRDGVNQ